MIYFITTTVDGPHPTTDSCCLNAFSNNLSTWIWTHPDLVQYPERPEVIRVLGLVRMVLRGLRGLQGPVVEHVL